MAPNVVFLSWVRCRGGLGAGTRFSDVRPYVRPSVRATQVPPSYLDPKKRQKRFKINGLGVFLGTPLGR